MKIFNLLLLITFINTQFIFSQCGNTNYPITQIGNNGIPDADRFVNLVIHIVKYNDCTGGINDEQVGTVIDQLNSVYNPKGIYFKINCILDFCSSVCYETPCEIENYYNTESVPNVLNLYLTVFSQLQCAGGKAQLPFPSKNCWAQWDRHHGAAHEIGHCLGLLHTNNIGNECVTRDQNNPNYNCLVAGDGICDTPADKGDNKGFVQSNCTWDITKASKDACEQRAYETDPSIIMGNFGCESRFTNDQALKMRDNIGNGSTGPQADPLEYSNHYVKIPTIWNTPKKFQVDVIVASELHIIGTTVEMAPGKRIKLLEGAKLLVDNSTIKVGTPSGCSSNNGNGVMWKGIEVHSTAAVTYLNLRNNSHIIKAEKGIFLATTSDDKPKITISQTTFTDNYIAIELISKKMAGKALIIGQSTFELTNQYPISNFSRQLYLGNYPVWGGVINFMNSKDINAEAGGLYSYNGFVLLNYVTLNGFLTGLEGIGDFANKNRMSINTGTFSKSARHISISTRRGNSLQYINITQGDRPDASGGAAGMNFGIKLNDCQSNLVRYNTFNNISSVISVAQGLETYRTGKELQIIGPYNSFNKYLTAVYSDNGCQEIEYLCNTHSNNAIDFYWTNARKTQGTSVTGAGNTFSVGQFNSSNIFTGYPIDYYYGIGANEFPQRVSPSLSRKSSPSEGCKFSFGTPLTDNPTDLNNDYQNLEVSINTLKANYPVNDLVIADSIHKLEILLHEVINQAIRIITSPTEGQIDNNLLILWLQRINTFESLSQIAFIHFMEGNYTQAYSELSLLPSQFNLNQSEQEDLTSMIWFFNFLSPIYQAGRWEGELTNTEIISLQNFASNTPTRIGLVATNILNFFYNNQNNFNQIKNNKNSKIENQNINNLQVAESIKLYPNPSRDFLNLEINNPIPNALYSFSIANMNGNIIDHMLIGKDILTYNTEKLSHGVYFITIFKDSIPIKVNKFFKSY